MSESGVDLDFDLLSPDGFDSQDEFEVDTVFYQLKSKVLDFSRYVFTKNLSCKALIRSDFLFMLFKKLKRDFLPSAALNIENGVQFPQNVICVCHGYSAA